MTEQLFADVDAYIEASTVPADGALEAALEASEAAGLPSIQVSPAQGKLLHLLVRMHGSRAILELGTLAAYSTIWLARALPAGGKLVTIESDPMHAAVARENLARAGLANAVDVRLGRGLDVLPALEAEKAGPFDFSFIDADKANLAHYFRWALKLSRPGSVIIVDNVVRGGRVLDAESGDVNVRGVRELYALLADEPRVTATAIQTVGSKGHDGFLLALVTALP